MFEGAVCDGCALRPQCVKAQPGRGAQRQPASPGGLAAGGPGLAGQRRVRRPTGPCARWPNTAWPVWCNWACARRAIAGASRPKPSSCWRPPWPISPACGQPPRRRPRRCVPEPDDRPPPRRRVVRGPTRRKATARIAETAAHRHAQPGADPSPPGPSMAPGYPCQASQYPLFDWTSRDLQVDRTSLHNLTDILGFVRFEFVLGVGRVVAYRVAQH